MKILSTNDQQFLNDFLKRPLIARMATVDPQGQPHVVPVWYGWDGEAIWISSYANTRKISYLRCNPNISISIDLVEENNHNLAVIMEGKVDLMEAPVEFLKKYFHWIYSRYLGEEGVNQAAPQEWIHDPLNLLIKLKPQRIILWK